MRRIIKQSLAIAISSIALASCGGTPAQSSSAESSSAGAAASDGSVSEGSATSSASGDVLVAYFSATGNTKAVAETIASATDADTFEVTPVDPYTSEDLVWSNEDSRVSQEHADESLQDIPLVSTTVDGWDSYEYVFVGYPIWWGDAAWPIYNFIKGNDFTGKTVIPFCTSSASGIAKSVATLSAMAGTGDWREGQRFASSPDMDEVASWAEAQIAS